MDCAEVHFSTRFAVYRLLRINCIFMLLFYLKQPSTMFTCLVMLFTELLEGKASQARSSIVPKFIISQQLLFGRGSRAMRQCGQGVLTW